MKRLSLILLALFAIGVARSTAYEMPKLFAESCGGVQYAYSSDRVWAHTSCSTGGRGARPKQVTACAQVTWNADGSLASTETLWITREVGTQYPHEGSCL